jgi:uncharacterized membrane protein HdeD (DUF308 family)
MAHVIGRAEGFPQYESAIGVLVKNWWVIALRGVLAIAFGLVALVMPGATMLSLVLIFAAYACVDGVLAIISAMRAASAHERWGYLVLEGLVDIAAGVMAIMWPGISVLAFVFVVAFWAIFTGCLEVAAAIRLNFMDGRWWLAFGGVVSVLYGLLLFAAPLAGAVVLTWWLGAYAIVFGVSLVVLAFKLRGHVASMAKG